MERKMYKILFLKLVAAMLVDNSFSYRYHFSDDTYDDDSLWTLSRNYRNEIENEAGEIKDVEKQIDIKMPDVSPQKPETYFCTARRMPDKDAYIVAYKPHAKMQTAHHMLMFGCDDVDNKDSKGHWECNEMGGTCKGTVNKIMYAWAMDAPALTLPDNVGFHVGGSSQIKYIVLQVHYANVDKFKFHHETDHSGVLLQLQSEKPQYFAGIYLVAAGGPPIPPKKEVFDMNMACHYTMGPEMHPFAFRVHTHKLGYVVTGYRVRDGKWHLIGKGDPKRPQAFYEVDSKSSLVPGDSLAARCTYNSLKRDHTTYIGATGADEMCNFYMMYWYDPAKGRSSDACEPMLFQTSDYPAETDEPLTTKKTMKMKRERDDEWDYELSRDLTDDDNWLISNPQSEDHQTGGFTADENWPVGKLQYKGLNAGQVSGVAIQTTGDVVIFHRASRIWGADTFDSHNVLSPELREAPITDDPVWFLKKKTGEVSRSWGKNKFYFPHGLSTDHEDNLWFTDVGMHQVFKYSKDGEKLLELGERFVPGSDLEHFCKLTDAAVEKDGSFFVSDGYCNSRILKFHPSGKFMNVIDHRFLLSIPDFPPPLNFNVPHGLSLDNVRGLLFVADRENGRVVAFDSHTRRYRGDYTGLTDQVFGVSFSPLHGGVLNAIVNRSPTPPFVYGSTIDLKTKKILQKWQPGFTVPHDIACDPSGRIVYVAEITSPGRLWKLKEEI